MGALDDGFEEPIQNLGLSPEATGWFLAEPGKTFSYGRRGGV
ncbi:MAG: hypothetical protein M5U12_13125 [Verrucomicrobia bacterium]|nr:hypothetical protein [Verrucomicrobiota bacterium]